MIEDLETHFGMVLREEGTKKDNGRGRGEEEEEEDEKEEEKEEEEGTKEERDRSRGEHYTRKEGRKSFS